MKFAEKVRKLTKGQNKAKIAEAAGMRGPAVSDLINKGNEPKASTALRLARVLNVPLDWLVDDEKDWPPPKERKVDANILTEHELMDALTLVWVESWQKLMREGEHLSRIDWAPPVKAAYRAVADGKKPPVDAMELIRRAWRLWEEVRLFRVHFDMEQKAKLYDFFREKPEKECRDYSPEELDSMLGNLESCPLFSHAINAVMISEDKNADRAKRDLEIINTVSRAVPAEGDAADEKWIEEHPDEIT